jgi:hypothetical protein
MTNSPPPQPPPVPYRRVHNEKKIMENSIENHRRIVDDNNHTEINQLSARNLQFSLDTSIGVATQTAVATLAAAGNSIVHDNGDVQCKINENGNGESL